MQPRVVTFEASTYPGEDDVDADRLAIASKHHLLEHLCQMGARVIDPFEGVGSGTRCPFAVNIR